MRLIDVDKLIEDIYSNAYACTNDEINKILHKQLETNIECIKQQPTAYDVDKVVEQLKKQVDTNLNEWKKSKWTDEATRPYLFAQKAYVKAINIVKAGGIDESI